MKHPLDHVHGQPCRVHGRVYSGDPRLVQHNQVVGIRLEFLGIQERDDRLISLRVRIAWLRDNHSVAASGFAGKHIREFGHAAAPASGGAALPVRDAGSNAERLVELCANGGHLVDDAPPELDQVRGHGGHQARGIDVRGMFEPGPAAASIGAHKRIQEYVRRAERSLGSLRARVGKDGHVTGIAAGGKQNVAARLWIAAVAGVRRKEPYLTRMLHGHPPGDGKRIRAGRSRPCLGSALLPPFGESGSNRRKPRRTHFEEVVVVRRRCRVPLLPSVCLAGRRRRRCAFRAWPGISISHVRPGCGRF